MRRLLDLCAAPTVYRSFRSATTRHPLVGLLRDHLSQPLPHCDAQHPLGLGRLGGSSQAVISLHAKCELRRQSRLAVIADQGGPSYRPTGLPVG
jgi:hypothetical protein